MLINNVMTIYSYGKVVKNCYSELLYHVYIIYIEIELGSLGFYQRFIFICKYMYINRLYLQNIA